MAGAPREAPGAAADNPPGGAGGDGAQEVVVGVELHHRLGEGDVCGEGVGDGDTRHDMIS